MVGHIRSFLKSALNYNKKEIFASISFIILFIVILIYFSPSKNEHVCNEFLHFVNSDYSGIVENIYVDKKNHNNKVIELRIQDNSYLRLTFDFDKSIFFNYVNLKDTLVKKRGLESIAIIRNGKDTVIYLDYGVKCY